MRALLPLGAICLCFTLGCGRLFGRDFSVDVFDVDCGGAFPDSEPPDSEVPLASVCGDYVGYYGTSTASSWHTRADWEEENDASGSSTRTVSDWQEDADGAEFTVEILGSNELPGYDDYEVHLTDRYRCDADGLWLLSYRLDYSYSINGQPNSGWVQSDLSEPMLMLRPELAVGAHWSGVSRANVTNSAGSAYEQELPYSFEVAGQETITVPAGRFSTLKLVQDDGAAVFWLDAERGVVRDLSVEQVDWTR